MFWCCSSLPCCSGYRETSTWHSFPPRLFPEHEPGISRNSEQCRLGWVRAPLKPEAHTFLCTWWAPGSPQWDFLHLLELRALGSPPGVGVAPWFWAQRFCVSGHSQGQSWRWKPELCAISAHGKHCWGNATLSETHSLTQTLRGLDVLTQTFPQPFYIPARGQASIPDPINGADRSGFLSEWGKLNSIKLL